MVPSYLVIRDAWSVIFPLSIVVFGAGVITTKKMQFQTKVPGAPPYTNPHPFRKPVIQVSQQMISEVFSLIIFFGLWIHDYRRKKSFLKKNPQGPTMDPTTFLIKPTNDIAPVDINRRNFFIRFLYGVKTSYIPMMIIRLLLPSVFYVACATCAAFAVAFGSPSLMECLATSSVIFQPIWQFLLLRKKLNCSQFLSLCVAFIGLIVATSTAFFSNTKSGDYPVVGVFLMISAQILSSLQYVMEEKYMNQRKYPPSLALGVEGVLGFIMTVIVLLILQKIAVKENGPIQKSKWFGFAENSVDSFVQMRGSTRLKWLILAYMICTFCFMFSGINTTKRFSSIHRVLLAASKAVLVWVVQLVMYPITHGADGETWSKYSFMQLGGFVVLIVGDILFQIFSLRKMHISSLNPTSQTVKQKPAEDEEEEGEGERKGEEEEGRDAEEGKVGGREQKYKEDVYGSGDGRVALNRGIGGSRKEKQAHWDSNKQVLRLLDEEDGYGDGNEGGVGFDGDDGNVGRFNL